MNTILVCTHNRPECLWVSLESLIKCRGIEKYLLYLTLNEDSDSQIQPIIRKLCKGLSYEIDVRPAGWLPDKANAEAMKGAADRSTEYFVLMLEDLIVSRDYLEFLDYAIHLANNDDRLFSVCGVAHPEASFEDVEGLIASQYYNAMGAAHLVQPFNKYNRQYFTEEYYRTEIIVAGRFYDHTSTFTDKYFPNSAAKSPDSITEQIIKKEGLYTLSAISPRCQTIGFYGCHAQSRRDVYEALFSGMILEDRVKVLREKITSKEIGLLFDLSYTPRHIIRSIKRDHTWKGLYIKELL